MESLDLCTHWVMECFVAIHYTAKAFYVLEFSIWGLGYELYLKLIYEYMQEDINLQEYTPALHKFLNF